MKKIVILIILALSLIMPTTAVMAAETTPVIDEQTEESITKFVNLFKVILNIFVETIEELEVELEILEVELEICEKNQRMMS